MGGSLKSSGIGYLIGDAALTVSGLLNATHEMQFDPETRALRDAPINYTETGAFKQAVGGMLYGMAGLVVARYGNPSTEKKLALLYTAMHEDLTRMGITIPKDATPELLAAENGVIAHIERFLYQNPTQIMSAIFSLGGVSNVLGGITARDPSMAASGALVTIGGLLGLLGKEQQTEGKENPLDWALHHPTQSSALAYTLNNGFLAHSAYKDHQKYTASPTAAKHSWVFKMTTLAAYLVSNFFLSKSSQNNASAQGDAEQQVLLQKLSETSARVVLAQPPAMQEAVLQQMSGYLAARPELNMQADTIATALQQQLHELAPAAQLARR